MLRRLEKMLSIISDHDYYYYYYYYYYCSLSTIDTKASISLISNIIWHNYH